MSFKNENHPLEMVHCLSILNNIEQPILATDNNQKIILCNRAAEKVLKIKAKEVIGQDIIDLFPESPPQNRILPRALKGEVLKDYIFHDTLDKNRIIKANARPIKNAKGEIIGAVNYFEDITELTKLQKKSDELDQLIQEHHFILNAMQNNVIIVDKDGYIKVWNRSMEKLTGVKAKQVLNSNMRDFANRFEVQEDPLLDTLTKGLEISNEKFQVTMYDQTHDLIVSTKLLKNNNKEILGAMTISTDVTELIKKEKIIEQKERLSSVSTLAAGLAHEIRNPLTSVRGFIQLLQQKQLGYNEYFNIILSEIDRTNKLIGDFLLLANPKEIQAELININCLINQTIYFMRPQALLHDIDICDQVDYSSTIVKGYQEELKQVFINLIKNAIEAINGKGLITINTSVQDGQAVLKFQDNGEGIPKKIQSKIFDVLFSTKEMGTGLGLSLCKQIIERHNGKIEVSSKSGKGSTFTIHLPISTEK